MEDCGNGDICIDKVVPLMLYSSVYFASVHKQCLLIGKISSVLGSMRRCLPRFGYEYRDLHHDALPRRCMPRRAPGLNLADTTCAVAIRTGRFPEFVVPTNDLFTQ